MRFNREMMSLIVVLLFISTAISSFVQADESKVGWVGISVEHYRNVAVKQDGTVWAWGDGVKTPTQIPGITDVISIAADPFDYTIALKKDGTVWSWQGQLEKEKIVPRECYPVQVKGLDHIKSISTSNSSNFAFKDDGTVWAWWGNQGSPIQLENFFTGAVSITVSTDTYYTLKNDGTLWREKDQLFNSNNIKQFIISDNSLYVLKSDGIVMAWGENNWGQLGDGTNIDRKEPKLIEGIRDVKEIAGTSSGIIYLKKDGTLWANGNNNGGQLGIGNYEAKNVPVQLKGMSRVKSITSNEDTYRAMALREDNTLWSWGTGYVGDGTEWYRPAPVMIKSYDSQVIKDIHTIWVDLNRHELEFDQPPIQMNNRTMVPLRKIFESFGAVVTWDQETSTVTATKDTKTIKLSVGSEEAYSNGQIITLDAPPVVINDRIMVPVRFISEAFGAKVNWDEATNTVGISY